MYTTIIDYLICNLTGFCSDQSRHITLVAIFLWSVTYSGRAQDNHLAFQHLAAADGVTGTFNDFIYQDSFGYVWIGSTEGLFRSDGLEVRKYLASETIQSNFFEDDQHNIWFSSYNAIHRYNRLEDKVHYYNLEDNGTLISGGYHVFFLEQGKFLWVTANNQIYRLEIALLDRSREFRVTESQRIIESEAIRLTAHINDKGEVDKVIGYYWMLKSGFEVIDFDPLTHSVCKSAFWGTEKEDEQILIRDCFMLKDGTIWFSTNQGLVLFDPNSNQKPVLAWNTPSGLKNFGPGTVFGDRYLYFSVAGGGIWVFDTEERRFIDNFILDECREQSISSNGITNAHFDRHDLLWLGHKHLSSVDFAWLQQNHFSNPLRERGLGEATVRSLVEDDYGRVWCATNQNGIIIMPANSSKANRDKLTITENGIRNLSKDSEGTIWAAGGGRLLAINPKKLSTDTIVQANGLQYYFLVHLSDDVKLVSTNEGLYELKKQGRNYVLTKSSLQNNSQFQTYQLFAGRTGTAFIPQNAKELLGVTLGRQGIEKIGLAVFPSEVYDVIPRGADSYWVATASGLYVVQGDSISQPELIVDDFGLAKQKYTNLQLDGQGFLWLVSNDELIRFDTYKHQVRKTGIVEGMPVKGFADFARLKTSDGRIWMAGDHDLIVFSPNAINYFMEPSAIRINSIEVNDSIYFRENPLNPIEKIKLKYFENNVQINLTGVTHYFAQETKIHYRILNGNNQWESIPNGEPIRLQGLSPQDYHLEIRSSNINGIQSQSRSLTIMVKPPVWQRPWFQILSVIASLLLFILIIRSYAKKEVRLFQERQKAILQEKERISKDLHDELGAGLTDIHLTSELGQENEDQNTFSSTMEKINNKAISLMENMDHILWALDRDNDSLENLVYKMREYLQEYLEDKNIKSKFIGPDKVASVMINGEKRHSILSILKEVVNNAVKHAQCTEIRLLVTTKDECLDVQISDNGKGFDMQKRGGGRGVNNIHQRVKAAGGSINCKSEIGKGTLYMMSFSLKEAQTERKTLFQVLKDFFK